MILNKLTLQAKLQTNVTNKVLLDKRETNKKQNKNIKQNSLPEPGMEPGTSHTKTGCVTFEPPSHHRLSIYCCQAI